MKNILITLTFIVACIVPTFAQKDTVTVISFNIRYNNPNDGDNIWENRRASVVNMAKSERPDFLCVQEAYFVQLEYLLQNLPDYDYKHGGEHMAILYNKARYEVVEHGDFWLSETPDVCSRGWDAVCHRIVTWGYFCDKQTGKHLYCFNTHLDHVGEVARRESVKLITQRIKEIVKDKKAAIYLTGDFNSDISSDIFVPLKKVLKQARKDAPVTDNKGTYNGWGSAANIFVIDHIFYKNSKPVLFKTLDGDKYGRSLISDHYPIKGVFVN